jgi:threonine/homoserine/homoserine lactone efflux protein
MTENWPHVTAVMLGIVAGFVASMPGGPVNATILGESAAKGIRWAIFVGLGAVLMEAVYCAVAFAGFSRLFESRLVRATMELASFILMLWLGIRYLRGVPIPGENRGLALVEHRFHPHTAFWTGFLRVLGNPGILLLWITVTATFTAREWLHADWPSRWLFVAGVAAGAFLWFLTLAWGVSRGHGRVSPKTLRRLSQGSGILLLGVAVAVGVRLVHLMAERSP